MRAERAFLFALGGGCLVPIGAATTVTDGVLTLRGAVLSPDGTGRVVGTASGPLNDADEILSSDHVRQRKSLIKAEIAPGVRAMIPNGCVEVDGDRAGFRHRAPDLGEALRLR